MRFAAISLSVLLSICTLSGCGGTGTGTTPGVPKGASEAIIEVRDIVLESSTMGTSFKKPEDSVNFEGKFPRGAAAVKDKSILVVWGLGLKEGASAESAKVVAYEAKTPNEGGWVVKEDGQIYQVTAADFSQIAPKAAKK